MKFTDTPTFKKGLLGENFVRKMLNQKGWITYSPDCDGAHYFDILATKNKQSVIAVDVKTKARFNKWAAQGIDIRHYNEYMRFTQQTGIPFYLVFVDDKNGDVHAGELAKLKHSFNPAPHIIAWPLSEMKKICTITDTGLLTEMSSHDTRKYNFNPTADSTAGALTLFNV
jgi:hypothetical protein